MTPTALPATSRPTATLTATPTRRPTDTPTPVPTPSPDVDALATEIAALDPWRLYENKALGLAFEYPSRFDFPPLTGCAPYAVGDNTVYMGAHISITVSPDEGLSLNDYVAELFATRADIEPPTPQDATVAGTNALYVIDQFGGLSRTAEAYFVKNEGQIYALQVIWGLGCEVDEQGMPQPELSLFYHLVETFRFLNPNQTPFRSQTTRVIPAKTGMTAQDAFALQELSANYVKVQRERIQEQSCACHRILAPVHV